MLTSRSSLALFAVRSSRMTCALRSSITDKVDFYTSIEGRCQNMDRSWPGCREESAQVRCFSFGRLVENAWRSLKLILTSLGPSCTETGSRLLSSGNVIAGLYVRYCRCCCITLLRRCFSRIVTRPDTDDPSASIPGVAYWKATRWPSAGSRKSSSSIDKVTQSFRTLQTRHLVIA